MTIYQTLVLYLSVIIITSVLCMIISKSNSYLKSKNVILKFGAHYCEIQHSRWWLLIFSFLPMIILAGTRVNTGADYMQYTWNYEKVVRSSELIKIIKESREPLYIVTEVINKYLFYDNVNIWFFTMSFFTIIILIFALYKIDKNINYGSFALLFGLYIYLHMFNYVRQLFATSLVILSLGYCLDKKYSKCFITILLATLMHQSSIVFILVFLLLIKKPDIFGKKYHFFMIISPIFLSCIVKIIKLVPYFSIYITRYFSGGLNIGKGWIIDVLPVIILYYLNYEVIKNNMSDKGTILAEISWMIIPIRALSYYSYAAGRLYIPFALFSITAYSSLINKGVNKKIKVCISFILLLCYFLFTFYKGNNSQVFPYSSLLF